MKSRHVSVAPLVLLMTYVFMVRALGRIRYGRCCSESRGSHRVQLVGSMFALTVGSGSRPISASVVVCLLLALAALLGGSVFWKGHRKSPQERFDAKLGISHSCGDGRKGLWQYLGPQEKLINRSGVLWRKFRICPTCGVCQRWPDTNLDPSFDSKWDKWESLLFNDMFERMKIREEHVAKLRKKEELEQRVLDEKRAQHEREVAEAARKERESNETAREFVAAKMHLLSEKASGHVET